MVDEGVGAEYKFQPPWLINGKILKKKHWLKLPKAVFKITKFGPKYK